MDKQQAQQLVDAARSLIVAHRSVADKTEYFAAIIEQIGNHTVVSTEFVLPEYWYTPNCPEATEWAKAIEDRDPAKDKRHTHNYITSSALGSVGVPIGTLITNAQFIEHVYLPWKAEQEKPRYWRLIKDYSEDGDFLLLKVGKVYPANDDGKKNTMPIERIAELYPNAWEPASEKDYLAQESGKKKDIDTVGNCANCGVEFHIHKPEQGAPFDESKTQRPDTDISNLTESPKFDPEQADWDRMYFAESEDATGVVVYATNASEWLFITNSGEWPLSICTHIDHEPIQRRN